MNKGKIPSCFQVMNHSKYPPFYDFIPTPSLDPIHKKENKKMIPHPTSHRCSLCSHAQPKVVSSLASIPLRVISQALLPLRVVVSQATAQPRGSLKKSYLCLCSHDATTRARGVPHVSIPHSSRTKHLTSKSAKQKMTSHISSHARKIGQSFCISQ
jgi:hypothetical protein